MNHNMNKQNKNMKHEKGMSRTEFAQEYSMEQMRNNCNKSTTQANKQQKMNKTK